MNHLPKPDTATATFLDGPLTIRLSIPAADAASWRTATTAAILDHLGLGEAAPAGLPRCDGRHDQDEDDGSDDEALADEGHEA